MKTVLLLVLSAWHNVYPKLAECAEETWESVEVPGFRTFFYRGDPRPCTDPKVIQFPIAEGLFDIGHRDLMAFKWALQDKSWDYFARTSANCYVRKLKLLDWCQHQPDKNLFQGVGVRDGDKITYLWGGGHYLMTRDVLQAIVDNEGKWNHREMEDVAMSVLVKEIGIPWDLNGQACSVNLLDNCCRIIAYGIGRHSGDYPSLEAVPEEIFTHFIRCKQDCRRHLDFEIMRTLHQRGIH